MYLKEISFIIFIVVLAFLIFLICAYGLFYSTSLYRFAGRTGGDEVNINWQEKNIYSRDEINNVIKIIKQGIHRFNPLGEQEKIRLHDLADKLTANSKTKTWSYDQLVALRYILSTDRSIQARYIAASNKNILNNITSAWKSGTKYSEIADKYDLPPIDILRHLYVNVDGMSREEFSKYLLDPSQAPDNIKENIIYARDHDSENPREHKQILKNAFDFEKILSDYISSKVTDKYKIQEELVEEQKQKYGQPMATPDILFDEPIIINVNGSEHKIKWIDAKNYILVDIKFINKSLRHQAEKYLKIYGPGAFVFHYGYDGSIQKIPNIIYLDGSFLGSSEEKIGGESSKSETIVRRIFESLIDEKFPQAHPDWLKNNNMAIMEIDGLNEKLRLAFEYQGPQHTKYLLGSLSQYRKPADKKFSDKSYEDYYQRLINDVMKRKQLQEHNIDLIIIDYKLSRNILPDYIKSRLYDIVTRRKNLGEVLHPKLEKFLEKPTNYILEQTNVPYRNSTYERELNLPSLSIFAKN